MIVHGRLARSPSAVSWIRIADTLNIRFTITVCTVKALCYRLYIELFSGVQVDFLYKLGISLIFAARCSDAICIITAYNAVAWCPSVGLTRSCIYCLKTSNRILKLFSPSGSHTIFHSKRYGNVQYGDLDLNGDAECRWGMKKIAIFDQCLSFCRVLSTLRPSGVINGVPVLKSVVSNNLK